MRLTASDIVRAIRQLPTDQDYIYVDPKNKGKIIIERVEEPEGPIFIKRYNPAKGQSRADAKRQSISSEMIWRIANAFTPGVPMNLDRVLGGSYNTRSVVEALLAHSPQFYFCYPGRIELISSSTAIKKGHKHLVWLPDDPHAPNVLAKKDTDIVVSEIPVASAVYEALVLNAREPDTEIDIETTRRHAQIQIALVEIGRQLGFRTWVAQNDRGIQYKDTTIAEMESVIARLEDVQLLNAQADAQHAAKLIDCIWFKNGRLMPAVIEIEHSTKVRSGLTRMKNFQTIFPPFPTRYVIAAADEDRDLVMRESSAPQFHSLNTQFFPYSAVEELYSLCQRRKITGVSQEFLDAFMEPCLPQLA